MDFPFTDAEQRFVLAEAIKTSSIPVEKLISFVEDGNVQPAWTQMLLPLGRNLKSCMDAWNALRPQVPQSYTPSHLAPYGPTAPPGIPISSAPHKRKPPSESGESFAAAHAPKRRQSAGDTTTSTQRVIQPKPSSNGQSPPLFSSPLPGQPKKRGRPSKAEVEARNADLVARGYVLPPPKASTPRSKPPELAPREPEPLLQRDPPFFHTRTSLPPILGPRVTEGPAPETEIGHDSRPIQASPLDTDPLGQGKKKKRVPPKQGPKDAVPGEGSPAPIVGAQPQLPSFETRPPPSAPVQVLAPRPSDRPSPIIVEASPAPAVPSAETSTKDTAGAAAESAK